MELVDGHNAGTLLKKGRRLTTQQNVDLVAQVCEALEHAHARSVIHQDVAPRNILIRARDHTAKLADFGLATDARRLRVRKVATVSGTAGYVAPEILAGAGSSPQSDLYSLAVVAYRLLGGPAPVPRGEPDATAPRAAAIPRLPPLADVRPDLPRGLTDAVDRALSHDRAARQDSVAEFREHLLESESASRRLGLTRAA
jgi:serine/threonine protein kinase